MNFLDKLEKEMKLLGIKNLHELSVKSKIPYSTLRGFYTKGYEKAKLPTLIALKNFLVVLWIIFVMKMLLNAIIFHLINNIICNRIDC